MATKSQDRIQSMQISFLEMVTILSGGIPGAVRVLVEWFNTSPTAPLEMLVLDSKRLYDHRIWELYKLCGCDIERFKYHVQVELPNQETGELSVTGPHTPDLGDKDFWEKRRFGEPGSFWALETPPSCSDYEYPIG